MHPPFAKHPHTLWNRPQQTHIEILLQEYAKLSEAEKILIGAIFMRKLEVIDAIITRRQNPEILQRQIDRHRVALKLLDEKRLRQLCPILQNSQLICATAIRKYYHELFKFPVLLALKLCDTNIIEATTDDKASKIEVVLKLAQHLRALNSDSNEMVDKILRFADEMKNPSARNLLQAELVSPGLSLNNASV